MLLQLFAFINPRISPLTSKYEYPQLSVLIIIIILEHPSLQTGL